MFLRQDTFTTIIEHTPLVSIDLVIFNGQGEVLLGERLNRPAQGYWFVPGGRIQKNESLVDAFSRLTRSELGLELNFTDASIIGAYDHFYDDCVFDHDISTHYVAIAYRLILETPLTELPIDDQHSAYNWRKVKELIVDPKVHPNTKIYF